MNKNTFIGTMDSFFWMFFKNFRGRINKECLGGIFDSKPTTSNVEFKYETKSLIQENEDIGGQGYFDTIEEYVAIWLDDFYIRGEFRNNIIAKFFFKEVVMQNPFFREMMSIYDCLYLDEYQDLSFSDFLGFESLKNIIGKSFLVGDTDQMIFTGKGANKKVANKIFNMGYEKMGMTINHRSSTEIQKIASKYKADTKTWVTGPKKKLSIKEIQEYIDDDVETLILFEGKKNIEFALKNFENAYFKIDLYQENIFINKEEYKIVEDFYLGRISKIEGLSFKNKIEIIQDNQILEHTIKTDIKKIFNFNEESVIGFSNLVKVLGLKIDEPKKAFDEMVSFYEGVDYKKIMPTKTVNTNIMTTSSCKGLQATRVIGFPMEGAIEKEDNISKNFVCITRAKQEIIFNPVSSNEYK